MNALRIVILIICVACVCGNAASAEENVDSVVHLEPVENGASLVVSYISGPAKAFLNQNVSIVFEVMNHGDTVSDSYEVLLFLSEDTMINPEKDFFLAKAVFKEGLDAGRTRKQKLAVRLPQSTEGKSRQFYYGAIVAGMSTSSSKKMSILRFEPDEDIVIDHKTGLMWQKADDDQRRNWSDAYQYCADLVLGEYTDWRLPYSNELMTIIDHTRHYPAVDPLFICHSANYWAATLYADYPCAAWKVGFHHGSVGSRSLSNSNYVRCVRGDRW